MNQKLIAIGILLALLLVVVSPVSAAIPGKSPLPPNSPFSTIWTLLQNLQNQINGLLTRMTAVEGDVSLLKSAGTAFQNQLNGLKTRMEAAEADIAGLKSTDADLQDQIDSLQPEEGNFIIKMGSFSSVDAPAPAVKTIDVPSGYTHDQCRVMVNRYDGLLEFTADSTPTTVTIGAPYNDVDGKFHPVIMIEDETQASAWGGQYLMVCQK